MRPFALTYPQLANQALALGLPPSDLQRLREAYAFAEQMADGLYRAQGAPFICHLVRTASIVQAEQQPIEVVAAALAHSAYMLHVFEASLRRPCRLSHRRQVQNRIGLEAESLVWEYNRLPWGNSAAIRLHLEKAADYPVPIKQLLVIRLANELEDYLDCALAYRGRFPVKEHLEAMRMLLPSLAQRLGRPLLGKELEEAFARYDNETIPREVIRDHRQAYERPKRRWQERPLPIRLYKRMIAKAKTVLIGKKRKIEKCAA